MSRTPRRSNNQVHLQRNLLISAVSSALLYVSLSKKTTDSQSLVGGISHHGQLQRGLAAQIGKPTMCCLPFRCPAATFRDNALGDSYKRTQVQDSPTKRKGCGQPSMLRAGQVFDLSIRLRGHGSDGFLPSLPKYAGMPNLLRQSVLPTDELLN